MKQSLYLVSALLGLAAAARADVVYDLTSTGLCALAYGLNNSGTVVGLDLSTSRGFVFDGQLQDLGTLGGSYSIAKDISDTGEIVGRMAKILASASVLHRYHVDSACTITTGHGYWRT